MNVNLKMKAKIFTFIFFLLIIQNSFSQKFDLGIKSGSNFATQNIKSISGTKSITGLHVGVFTYIKLPLIFGIQPELQYSTQGTKINSSTIRSINYLNVPILVRSSFGPMNIHFGPQFGILTGAINEVSGIPTDIKDKFLKRDFSLILDVSVEPVDRFIFSVRYVKGLKNISDDDPFANETKNTTFQFSFGYVLIRIKDKNSKKNSDQ
tara:strand:- start:665 stop:1288 length:624 start_codon:yes stop_codon:yes gene_type:complete